LVAAEAPTLTLTTCWPIRYLGPAPDRLIITAEPVIGATAG
jgi:sortase (surface protein transpeptidase)